MFAQAWKLTDQGLASLQRSTHNWKPLCTCFVLVFYSSDVPEFQYLMGLDKHFSSRQSQISYLYYLQMPSFCSAALEIHFNTAIILQFLVTFKKDFFLKAALMHWNYQVACGCVFLFFSWMCFLRTGTASCIWSSKSACLLSHTPLCCTSDSSHS